MASKDLSNLQARNISLAKSKYGFVAYQKKPEFGPAKIIINSFTHNAINQLYTIEKKSTLELSGQVIRGTQTGLSELLLLQNSALDQK